MTPTARMRSWSRALWACVTAALLVVLGSMVLAGLWMRAERTRFWFGWDAGASIAANLCGYEWSGTFSITGHDDPDKPGYVLVTFRQWRIGPIWWRRVIYVRPGMSGDWISDG